MNLTELYHLFKECDSVSTDTRKIARNSLFFALKGESFDGNQFAFEALDKGAAAAVVDDLSLKADPRFEKNADRIIYFEHEGATHDALTALQTLAHHHRMQYSMPVIAICGSNGKTTTKELTAAVLSEKYLIVKTEDNHNNHIGVPLTLLRIKKSTEIAVIEIGANHLKETAALCEIVAPTHGVITNNGSDHLEGFGSKENVAIANGELYEYLRDHMAIVFINETDPSLTSLLYSIDPGCSAVTIRYGQEVVPENPNLFGDYNKENMRTAYAIGKHFKVPTVTINKALRNYVPTNMRSQIISTSKGNDIILDAYNANPSSMHAVIESFSRYTTTKPKWLILGDMKELGAYEEKEHANILNDISFYGFTNVVLIGPAFTKAHESVKRYAAFPDRAAFLGSPFASSIRNSAVLIKGSNSMKMWEIKDVL